jgi:hypothetical protein
MLHPLSGSISEVNLLLLGPAHVTNLLKKNCMLLELFQTTTVNTKQKQDMHGVRLVDDRDDNQTRSDASVLLTELSILPCDSISRRELWGGCQNRLPHPL